MTFELLFWILMLIWVVFWGVGLTPQGALYWGRGGWIILFVLVALLGYKVFGPPVH